MELTFGERFPKAMKQIKQCNILVIGNTGTGKSTLIGALFPPTKINGIVTQTISEKPYKKPGLAIAVYDSPGLEKDKKQQEKVKQEIAKFIKQQKRKEPGEQIHTVWYCVNSQVTKESEIDQIWLDTIAKEVPIISVITRASGIEDEWLKPFLEEVSSIRRVVSVMALQEKTPHYNIQPHGLDSLLFVTEDLLEELAKTAISNAINAKADSAFGWCKAGCIEVFSTRLLPIPFFQGQVTAFFQTWMLAEIAKTFGCEFDKTFLRSFITAGVGVAGFDSFFEQVLNNFPGMNQDNIQTIQEILPQFSVILNQVKDALPFQAQLLELLKSFDNSHFNPVGGLPIFKCITASASTLLTGILGLTFIDMMKAYKQAEYEGQPFPKLEEEFQERMRQAMASFQCWFGGDLPVLQPVLQADLQ